MPRGGGGRLSGRKRKAVKSPTKESSRTGRDADVINVLKAGVTSATILDENYGDLAEFQASSFLSKRRKKEPVKPDGTIRKAASQKRRERKRRMEEKTLSETSKDKDVSSNSGEGEWGKRSSPRKVKGTKEAAEEVKEKVKEKTDDKLKTVNSPRRRIKISPVKNIGSQRKQREGSKSVSPDKRKRGRPLKVPRVRCPCCDRTAMEIFLGAEGDMNDHALICLHEKFSKENAASTSDITGPLMQTDASENMEPIMCQICNRDLTRISEAERTKHVNRCMDGPSRGDVREVAGSTPQDSDAAINEEDGTDEDEEVICQICSKNISHMNSRRRMQHVNRCIDSNLEVDQSPAEDNEPPPSSPTQDAIPEPSVPSCIICGIALNTQQKKRNHLKSCALKNNITTVQLLDMVKKQEMGMLVENVQPSNKSKKPAADRVKKVGRPRKKKKEDLDEDVQVAMAITASIAEQEDEERRAMGLPAIDRQVSDKSPSKKIKKRRGRPRKQGSIQFHPLLTRTLSENKKIWEDKIATVIERPSQPEYQTPHGTASLLAGRLSKKAPPTTSPDQSLSQTEEAVRPIWQLTKCDALLGSTPFYVDRLLPFVTSEQRAKKTKKTLRFEDETSCTDAREQQTDDVSPSGTDACQGVITQEAISALAGLIAEDSQDEDETRSRVSSPPASGFIPPSAHNNDANLSSISRPQQALLESLRDLVDSPAMDPIIIRTRDNQTVHAHGFILNLRCPKLLEENNISLSHRKGPSRREIRLHDFDKAEIVALMAYFYAGDTDFPASSTPQIRRFAKRYNLEELEAIFQRKPPGGEDVSGSSPGQSEHQEKDIEDLIESIWCDKNDKSVTQRGETSSENSDEPPDNADLTEIYEFALSQRNSSTSKEVENTDNSNPESVVTEEDSCRRMEITSSSGDKGSGAHLNCNGKEEDKAQQSADELNDEMNGSDEQEKKIQESTSLEEDELSDDVLQDMGEEEMLDREDTVTAAAPAEGRNSRTDGESDDSTNHETSVDAEMQTDSPPSPMIGKEKVVVIPFQNTRKPGRPKNSKIRLHSKVGGKQKQSEKERESNGQLEDRPTPGRRKSGITAKQGSCQFIEETSCDKQDFDSAANLDSERQSQSLNQSDVEAEKQASPKPTTPRKRGRPSAKKTPSGLSRLQGSDGDVSGGSSTASPRRKRGRPRKLSKENKSSGSSSQTNESVLPSDSSSLHSGRKPDSQSYLLVERRWSLRSPQETPEKSQPLSSSPKKRKRASGRGRKSLSVPERFQVLKLATKKRGFKFKKMNSKRNNSKKIGLSLQNTFQHSPEGDEDESSKGSPVTVRSEDEEDNIIEIGEKNGGAREKTTSDAFDQVWENWNNSRNSQRGLEQSKDKVTTLDKSASLFEDDDEDDVTEDKVEVAAVEEEAEEVEAEEVEAEEVEAEEVEAEEVVHEVEEEVESDDVSLKSNSPNSKGSPSFRTEGIQFISKSLTPSSIEGKRDRIHQLKVNLGKKLNILHLKTNSLSLNDLPGLNLDKDETGSLEVSNLLGKENKPEIVSSKESISEATRRNELCDSDDFAASPVLATPLSSYESAVPSTSSSPVFDKPSSGQTEVEHIKVDLTDGIDKGALHPTSPLSVTDGNPLKHLPVSSDCLRSLETDGQVFLITEVTTDQVNGDMIYAADEPQPAVEQMEFVEDQEEGSHQEDVGEDAFAGADFAEEFAFDQEVLGFGDDICVEEVEVSCAPSENGIVFGDDEEGTTDERNKSSPSSPSKIPRDDDERNDSIDLTKDDDDATRSQDRSKFLSEIDLTDDEGEPDTNGDPTQEDGARDVSTQKVTSSGESSQLYVHGRGSSGSTTPRSVSGEGKDNGAVENESPLIPGCSRSFIEDLASAPNDEEFWTEEDLGLDWSGNRYLRNSSTAPVNAKTPSAPKIVSARSVSFEEFLSPAPVTPMPPYDEMVTPELVEHLGKYGVKKLKKKQARLKLKEIYQYTHQVLGEDESPKTSKGSTVLSKEKPVKHKKSKKSKHSPKRQHKKHSPKKQKKKKNKMSDESTKSRSSSALMDGEEVIFAEPEKVPKKSAAHQTTKSSLKRTQSKHNDKESENHIGGDSEPGVDICSQSSGGDDRDDFGEGIISDEDSDEEIPPSQMTSNPDESIRDFILRTPKFYEKCLLYQPFDLDEFHKDLKADHIKVSKSCLMNVLDAMCLTFRHKNRVRRSPKKSRKPGRSPKKRVILTPKKSLSLS